MPAYALAQLSIHDRVTYNRYTSQFMRVLSGFRGRVLAADESPEVVAGEWPHQKVVLLEFPDRDELERWATSPQFVEISKDRIAATTGSVLVVTGVAAPTGARS
jgi:uncharacterized protein (DUF1330 family)